MATILDLGPAHDAPGRPDAAGAIRLSLLDGFELSVDGKPAGGLAGGAAAAGLSGRTGKAGPA